MGSGFGDVARASTKPALASWGEKEIIPAIGERSEVAKSSRDVFNLLGIEQLTSAGTGRKLRIPMSAAFVRRNVNSPWHWLSGFVSLFLLTVTAADWPQFRGPNQDGISADRIIKDWSGTVTNAVWLVPVSNSLCSFAVSGSRAVTQIKRTILGEAKEVCVALSITNGAELWATTVDVAEYPQSGVGFDDGPRSTPSMDANSVYVLTSYLHLYRLNVTNGAIIWHKDLRTIYGGNVIPWQNAASPSIDNGLIFLNANCGASSLMALRASDGEPAWRSQNEAMTHSTPTVATIQGVRQVIFATQSGLVSLNPLSGNLLWRFNYPFIYSTSLAISPVVHGDLVFVGGAHAYGMASVVMRASLTNGIWTTAQLWRTNNPASHWMTPVAYQGNLYGQFGIQQFDSPTAQLKCIDMQTGVIRWSTNGFGRAGTLLVNDHLLVITEVGDLVLVKPDPTAYIELGRFQAIPNYFGDDNKCWNIPAVAEGRVYVRSTSWGACYDLSVPGLQLDPPERTPANLFSLTARTINGAPIASNRLTGMELRSSTNASLGLAAWAKVANPLVLTNGIVRVTNVDLGSASRGFFLISEPK